MQTPPAEASDAAIARAIISLAHGLQLTVVTEGVETLQQQAFLRREGCDQAQGFLLGRPVGPAAVPGLLMAAS